jgi:hypothetical protein
MGIWACCRLIVTTKAVEVPNAQQSGIIFALEAPGH